MKVANVWVNTNNLPTKEEFINQALKTSKYSHYAKPEAIKLIQVEIKESGLKFPKDGVPSKTKTGTRRTNK